MKFSVFHRKNYSEFLEKKYFLELETKLNPDEFELVAVVNCKGIEQAYHLTNHIDVPWHKNSGVECFKRSRSTSVGDVVVDEENKVFICDRIGWKPAELIPEC